MNALSRLEKFARREPSQDRCGLCACAVEERHPHLVEVARGKLLCTCLGCAGVLAHGSAKFRRVPERVTRLADFRMADDQWHALAIPVGIAFFQKSTPREGMVAFYPSPLGAVETSVPAEAWDAILRGNPVLGSLEDDVEALLIRRSGSILQCFIVPLDACYGLIGLMRRDWRGFTGGQEVEKSVERFFEALHAKSGGAA